MPSYEPRTGISGRGYAGLSLLEWLVGAMILGLLIGVAAPAMGRAQARRRVMNARDSFVWLATRARTAAVERGTVTSLELDPGAGRALVLLRLANATDSTLEVVGYGEKYKVAVSTASGTTIRVCYNSRGYAIEGACTMAGLPDLVVFTNSSRDTARAQILSLGQVERR